jgi:hypothetical protein
MPIEPLEADGIDIVRIDVVVVERGNINAGEGEPGLA